MSEPNDQRAGAGNWRNWTGDERCMPAAIERPASLDQLSAAIAAARSKGLRVRVAGAGHSFNDIACSDGLLLKLDGMAGVLDIDRSAGLVRTQAGITLRELSRPLAAG